VSIIRKLGLCSLGVLYDVDDAGGVFARGVGVSVDMDGLLHGQMER